MMKLTSQDVSFTFPRKSSFGIDAMEEVSAIGRRALADTRRLLGVLRDDSADAARELRRPMPDLSELDGLIERVRAAGLPTTLEVRGSASSAATAVQVTAYRLVQGALTNTLKHGGPGAHAAVSLQHRPNHLLISVDDDGAGPGAPTPTTAGGGLAGMRERVLAYGGDLEAGLRSPTGWRSSAVRVAELVVAQALTFIRCAPGLGCTAKTAGSAKSAFLNARRTDSPISPWSTSSTRAMALPPKPPPVIRAPHAPAPNAASTATSSSGHDTS